MKKLITLLTTLTLTTIPIIGVVSCGTGTPKKINDKKNITLSFDLNEPIKIPKLKDAEPPAPKTIQEAVFYQAQREGKIPMMVNEFELDVTSYSLESLDGKTENNYMTFKVKDEIAGYTGILNVLSFKINQIYTIGSDPIAVPTVPDNEEHTNMLDLTQFDEGGKGDEKEFKKELISIAKGHSGTKFPDAFFNDVDNFKLDHKVDGFKHNKYNQTIIFFLDTSETKEYTNPNGNGSSFYEGHFIMEFNNAISNEYNVNIYFDEQYPPTSDVLKVRLFTAMQAATKENDPEEFQWWLGDNKDVENTKSYDDYYDFIDWKGINFEEKLNNFGDVFKLPQKAIGIAKDDHKSFFSRSHNDISINATININSINLEEEEYTFENKTPYVVKEGMSDEELSTLETTIWNDVVKNTKDKIDVCYPGYKDIDNEIKDTYFDYFHTEWQREIEKAIPNASTTYPKKVPLIAKIKGSTLSNEQKMFIGSLTANIYVIKEPTIAVWDITPIKLLKGENNMGELLDTFKAQIEKQIVKTDKQNLFSTTIEDDIALNLEKAVREAFENNNKWIEYEQFFPSDNNSPTPVKLLAKGKLNITDTPINDDIEIDFKDVSNLTYFTDQGETDQGETEQLMRLTNTIFKKVTETFKDIENMDGISTLFEDWEIENNPFFEALKIAIKDSEFSVNFNKSLNLNIPHTPFTGNVVFKNLTIFKTTWNK